MGMITALLITGSGHVAMPFSFKHFGDDDRGHFKDHFGGNNHQTSNQDDVALLNQEAANICASNVVQKSKIKIEAKNGALVQITCVIMQRQTLGGHSNLGGSFDPILNQQALNGCASNIDGKGTVNAKGNKIEINAKNGSVIKITCTIRQMQNAGAVDPIFSQDAVNICGSNVGSKNKLEIKAKDGSSVVITCINTQTQMQIQQPTPSPPVDPLQDAANICGSNVGSKNQLKIEVKNGSTVAITCTNTQTQTMGVDPLLVQEAVNICGSNIGAKNKTEIKAKDGSSVLITCANTQTQTVM